jgi:hypothetical protein
MDSDTSDFTPIFHVSDYSRGFASRTLMHLDELFHQFAHPILLCHYFGINVYWWYWNFDQLSIGYASQPRLRSRLTLSGRTFLRKP